jgi:hypothetical protein
MTDLMTAVEFPRAQMPIVVEKKYLQGSCIMSSTSAWGPWPRPFCFRWIIPLVAVLAPLFLAGCGTLENGRGWGQDAAWPLDLERIGRAGRDALLSPATWVPLAGAGVFALGDLDERVSDWASEHHPLFGSQSGAEDAGNYLVGVLGRASGPPWRHPVAIRRERGRSPSSRAAP